MGYFSVFILISACVCEVIYGASISTSGYNTPSKPKGFGSAKRAVIIGIDGLGGSYLRNVTQNYATFRSFIEQGSYTTRARGVFPTSSGPNWGSYLTGMGVMEHGIFCNGWKLKNGDPSDETTYSIPPLTGRGRPETIFTQVKRKDPNLKTALMFTWTWLQYFAVNNTDVDDWFWGGGSVTCAPSESYPHCTQRKDDDSLSHAKANLMKNDPILTFLHMDSLDAFGHETCWGCPEYYTGLKGIELRIQSLIDHLNQTFDSSGERMLDGTFLVIVSDHGGWRDTHSFTSPFTALVDIPILIRGPGVLWNNSLEDTYVSNLDVAATVLNAIGVDKSEFMRGQVLERIYQ